MIACKALLVLVLMGCAGGAPRPGAEPPVRARVRAAVLAVAEGVSIADKLCARLARDRKDLELATNCIDDYRTARDAALAAERSLDAGDVARAGCQAAPAVRALASMTKRVGDMREPALDDALVMAEQLIAIAPCRADDGGSP